MVVLIQCAFYVVGCRGLEMQETDMLINQSLVCVCESQPAQAILKFACCLNSFFHPSSNKMNPSNFAHTG